MSAPAFRYAIPADVNAIVALIEHAYRAPETAGRWDSESHLLTGPRTSHGEIAGLVADPASRFLIAEIDGRVAACCLLQKRGVSESDGAYFGMFAIQTSARAGGMGKLVLAEAERRVRELWNVRAMVMTVINVRTELIAWYQRRGYLLTGARIPFPFSETSGETTRDFDLVEMRKELS
jgi:N-acetylglutamate synthase-like GNAT family acetyltransferase